MLRACGGFSEVRRPGGADSCQCKLEMGGSQQAVSRRVANAYRDSLIRDLRSRGWSYREIGAEVELSQVAVMKVIKRDGRIEATPEELARALQSDI